MTSIWDRANRQLRDLAVYEPGRPIEETGRELGVDPSEIIKLASNENALGASPKAVAAMRAAIESSHLYPDGSGYYLRNAIADRLGVTPQSIILGNGSNEVIEFIAHAFLNRGDDVVTPQSSFIAYKLIAQLFDAQTIEGRTVNFGPDLEALLTAITPRTKWFLFNQPCNPSGACYTREQLQSLTHVLLDHPQVWVLADDMYEHLTYDDFRFATVAEVEPRLRARTLTMNGVSKAYAMTGWRIGYAAGPAGLIAAINKLQSQMSSCPSSISQAAAAHALDAEQTFVGESVKLYRERRDYACERLNAVPHLRCLVPDGAFYLYPSCAGAIGKVTPEGKTIDSDLDFVLYLLNKGGVASVHGAAYGLSPYFRLSTATSMEMIKEACDRIEKACSDLR